MEETTVSMRFRVGLRIIYSDGSSTIVGPLRQIGLRSCGS